MTILFEHSQYGCHKNSLSVDELFELYEKAGFTYPAKKEIISPYYATIKRNWRLASKANLLHIVSYGDPSSSPWASLTSWLHTNDGWTTQHMVGIGGPIASRSVMLCEQAYSIQNEEDCSHQNFFQRKKRFPNRIFGTMGNSLQDDSYYIHDYSYLTFPKAKLSLLSTHTTSAELSEADVGELQAFVTSQRSSVFAAAEHINKESIELNDLNEQYQAAGLFRYRKICVVRKGDRIIGCAIAYRGPLGLNFSFLENRCELIIDKHLSKNETTQIAEELLVHSALYYIDFEPEYICILTDSRVQASIENLGGQFLRSYTQGLWTRSGYHDWYKHVETIYERVMQAYSRRDKQVRC